MAPMIPKGVMGKLPAITQALMKTELPRGRILSVTKPLRRIGVQPMKSPTTNVDTSLTRHLRGLKRKRRD